MDPYLSRFLEPLENTLLQPRSQIEDQQPGFPEFAAPPRRVDVSRIPVSPVLVPPGWWVEAKGKGPVAVLNPKGLPNFLTGRPSIFSDKQFRALHAQLEERCRIDLSR